MLDPTQIDALPIGDLRASFKDLMADIVSSYGDDQAETAEQIAPIIDEQEQEGTEDDAK